MIGRVLLLLTQRKAQKLMNRINRFKKETGLELIAESTVWNFHSVDFNNFAFMKTSNVYFQCLDLKRKGVKGMVTVIISSIGRSQHSASTVAIFKGTTSSQEYSGYYMKGHGEVNLNHL